MSAFWGLPDWPPDISDVRHTVRRVFANSHRRNPEILAEFKRCVTINGNVAYDDGQLLDMLASLAVTLPLLLGTVPEFRDTSRIDAALAAIKRLSGRDV